MCVWSNSTDIPNRVAILLADPTARLNPALATLHTGLLEKIAIPEQVDFIYFFDVL